MGRGTRTKSPIGRHNLESFCSFPAAGGPRFANHLSVVQLFVRLVAPEGGNKELVHALRGVMRGACQDRGCRFAQVYCLGSDDVRVDYIEEWTDADDLRTQFRSERFLHLLALLETAAERPVVEFRIISATYGLEYMSSTPAVYGTR